MSLMMLAHRGVEPAGRVELDHGEPGLFAAAPLQAAAHVVDGGRADGAVEFHQHDGAGRKRARMRRQARLGRQPLPPHGRGGPVPSTMCWRTASHDSRHPRRPCHTAGVARGADNRRPMVRPTQLLHPQREPAPVRAAATVLLLRDTPDGIEVLMTRRSATASFAPGAYVFPGGAHRRRRHRRARASPRAAAPRAACSSRRPSPPSARASRNWACCWPTMPTAGRSSADDVAAMDRSTATTTVAFADQCAARGLLLSTDQVFTFAHWITDRDLPKRFDVPFLVARMPEGQTPAADETEQFEPVLGAPGRRAGAPRGRQLLHDLPDHAHARAAGRLHDGRRRARRLRQPRDGEGPLWTSCPRAGLLARRGSALHGDTSRPSANWRWSAPTARSCTRSTGRASSRCRC